MYASPLEEWSITDRVGADSVLPSTAGTPEAALIAGERQAYLRDAIEVLPERLQVVIRGCFFEDRPMRELAEDLGVTESRISQMRAEALKMLRVGMRRPRGCARTTAASARPVLPDPFFRRSFAYAALGGHHLHHRQRSSNPGVTLPPAGGGRMRHAGPRMR